MNSPWVDFDDGACTCHHAADEHDDGFGCTALDCPCLAQWFWGDDDDGRRP